MIFRNRVLIEDPEEVRDSLLKVKYVICGDIFCVECTDLLEEHVFDLDSLKLVDLIKILQEVERRL